jgi:hypothetical protein
MSLYLCPLWLGQLLGRVSRSLGVKSELRAVQISISMSILDVEKYIAPHKEMPGPTYSQYYGETVV